MDTNRGGQDEKRGAERAGKKKKRKKEMAGDEEEAGKDKQCCGAAEGWKHQGRERRMKRQPK